MNKKNLVEKFETFAYKLGQEKHLLALRDGMVLAMPLILVGSLFLIIGVFPINAWQQFLKDVGLMGPIKSVADSTFGLMGLVAVFGIAKKMSEIKKVSGTGAGVIALATYIMLIPKNAGSIKMGFFGSKGLFIAIIVGLIAGKLFAYLVNKNIVIKMPDTVPPAVSKSFASVIPGFIIISLFLIVDILISKTGYNSFDIVIKLIAEPLRNISDSYFGTLFVIFLNSFIWMFGIHGGQVVGGIMDPIWYMNTDANRLAYEAGQVLPHIVTRPFLNSFVWIGGSGASFGLAIFLFFFAKSIRYKTLGKVAFVPDIFSVNEPMLFGIPIILNLNLVIPFMLAPMATGTIAYFATYFGWVAKTIGVVIPWPTPPIISGYLSTGGHISGAVLQIVNIFVAFLIYYPFIKMIDNQVLKEEKEKLEEEVNE